jgi:hypothetical protein
MHSCCVFGAYTNNNVIKNKASTLGCDFNLNVLVINNAEFFAIFGSEVDVTLCRNNTVL